MPFWKAGRREGRATRIFFASDIHGSDATYAKFLAAADRYEVDCLVFGGDLMGKALVPIVESSDGRWTAYTSDGPRNLASRPQVDEFIQNLTNLGLYWWQGSRTEYDQFMQDQGAVEREFEKAAAGRLERWVDMANKKFATTSQRVFLCGGNDDTDALVSLLDQLDSQHVINCDNRVVQLDDKHQMLTLGWSTPTPWNTPREKSEPAIQAELDRLMGSVTDPASLVVNVHVPPIDSGLDTCMKLDAFGMAACSHRERRAAGLLWRWQPGSGPIYPNAQSRGRSARPHPRVKGAGPDRAHPMLQRRQRILRGNFARRHPEPPGQQSGGLPVHLRLIQTSPVSRLVPAPSTIGGRTTNRGSAEEWHQP